MTELQEPEAVNNLRIKLLVADLIETCQGKELITPANREEYFKRLNDSTHKNIDAILKELEG